MRGLVPCSGQDGFRAKVSQHPIYDYAYIPLYSFNFLGLSSLIWVTCFMGMMRAQVNIFTLLQSINFLVAKLLYKR